MDLRGDDYFECSKNQTENSWTETDISLSAAKFCSHDFGSRCIGRNKNACAIIKRGSYQIEPLNEKGKFH